MPGFSERLLSKEALSDSGLALWLSVTGLIVLCFVTVGWWLLFREMVSNDALAWVLAGAVTGVAVSLARFLAKKRAMAKLADQNGVKWYYGWPTYAFLFVLSALGTINAAFVLFEGPSVVRQDMAEVQDAYKSLQTNAHDALRIEDYEKNRARLDGLLLPLKKEIDNPNGGNYCGVGPAADAIISDIRRVVPNMPIIRGTGIIRPCDHDKAEAVYSAYRDSAYAALNGGEAFITQNGPAKYAYLAKVDQSVAAVEKEFRTVAEELTGPTSHTKPEVQGALQGAASRYKGDLADFASLDATTAEKLPARVDVSQSQELGSLAAVMHLLYTRLGYWTTWAYLFIAVLLDFALVYFLTQAFMRLLPENSAQDQPDAYKDPKSHQPRFLWNNPKDANKVRLRHV